MTSELRNSITRSPIPKRIALLDTEPAPLYGERGLLVVLIRNLLDNALRYSPEGSQVQVRCRRRDGRIEFVVCDNGPGIPAAERDRIFERFYRVVGNESTGSGLGLSIVRSIAELHGGRVEVHEGPTGTGTSFVVSLPEAGTACRTQVS